MNLRLKFVVLHTLLVSVILVIAMTIVYIIYSNTRNDDLGKRLWVQAISRYKAFDDDYAISAEENDVLNNSPQSTVNELHITVLDKTGKILYEEPKFPLFSLSPSTLADIYIQGHYFYRQDTFACFGFYVKNTDRYVIASSNDKYGLSRMAKLRFIMLLVGVGAVAAVSTFSFLYVMKTTKPLVELSLQMRKISEDNLRDRFKVGKGNIRRNEIMQISANFNSMLDRLEKAFDMQKSFTHHASHELRTPLASMLAQTEIALRKNLSLEEAKDVLTSLKEDQQELIELTNSLLLLSQYEKITYSSDWPMVRVDELLYDTISAVKRMFTGISVSLEFLQMPENEINLSISGNYTLLRSAFRNLIKNAFQYSEDKNVSIAIKADDKTIEVYFDNKGKTLNIKDKDRLFIPFFRGENAIRKRGFGLGLSIVKRIVQLHQGIISYEAVDDKINRFIVRFKKA
ncbi:MAG TPA: HAMP domain-containing sensor histidine kinase [Chitinophagaceae bacterium]|nr:HAMP domain-containing sensor histidine kinase [Chitinophagaceae bacterium]